MPSELLKTITYRQVIDLSHPIHPQIPLWQGDPSVEFETVAQLDSDGYYLRRFAMGEHSGTHINAPNSFFADAVGIDAYRPESLIVPAIAIDLQAQAATNPDYCLSIDDILAWEQEYGQIPENSVVLLHTNWQARWHDPQAFLNCDAQGGYHFPGFGADSTRFLLAERAIAGVGTDTHGVDSGQDTTFSTNKQVLANQGIVLENLANLDQLPPRGSTLILGILRLQNGSGSPLSVLALIP
ncbi:MAG TPA: cyclase family protein [Leptolyngbyaceae cyanobacterium M33_DOE_097]|uniref:Cyclase family protein n=1 Tax=Oscillatoriales cyanobacterium SpSt-418 TaxID=2282169 RepID=A0A7C3PEF1_9CYAN|nr:cyclase family protein [Leptolyngbyaceae cyanobacterium M33_DOE_097]